MELFLFYPPSNVTQKSGSASSQLNVDKVHENCSNSEMCVSALWSGPFYPVVILIKTIPAIIRKISLFDDPFTPVLSKENAHHETDVWAGLKTHPVYTPKLFEGGAAPSRNFIKTFAEGLTLISNVRVCIKSVLKCVSVWLAPHPFTSWGASYAGAHLRSVLCVKWQKDELPNWASFVPVHCCKIWFQIRTSGQCCEWRVFIFCQHFNHYRPYSEVAIQSHSVQPHWLLSYRREQEIQGSVVCQTLGNHAFAFPSSPHRFFQQLFAWPFIVHVDYVSGMLFIQLYCLNVWCG